MNAPIGSLATARSQSGAALVMGMIFLVLITVLGLTTMGVSALEERMAANARDRIRAFQAAEAALRFCEGQVTPTTSFDGTNGMYLPAAAGQPPRWESIDWTAAAAAQTYAGNIALVASQPRCIAEQLGTVSEGSVQLGFPNPLQYGYYRITARGVGVSANTVVLLQSTVKLAL